MVEVQLKIFAIILIKKDKKGIEEKKKQLVLTQFITILAHPKLPHGEGEKESETINWRHLFVNSRLDGEED